MTLSQLPREAFIVAVKSVMETEAGHDTDTPALESQFQSLRSSIQSVVSTVDSAGHYYLARNIPPILRGLCCLHHFSCLAGFQSKNFLDAVQSSRLVVFEHHGSMGIYTVTVGFSQEHTDEGELSLEFRVNGHSLYCLAFTIVPGQLAGMHTNEIILISRMQGRSGKLAEIQNATRDMSAISPQSVLYAAMRGIAKRLNISHIIGVAALNQISCLNDKYGSFKRTYDQFYESVGAVGPRNGFYIAHVDSSEKPLNLVKPGHRLRTKLKREIKARISQAAFNAWPERSDVSARGFASQPALGDVGASLLWQLIGNRNAEFHEAQQLAVRVRAETEAVREEVLALRQEAAVLRKDIEALRADLASAQIEKQTMSLQLSASVAERAQLEFENAQHIATAASQQAKMSEIQSDGRSLRSLLNWYVSKTARRLQRNRSFWMRQKDFEYKILKHGLLDEEWYLKTYPDVAAARVDPAKHYLTFGASEARDPNPFFSTRLYLREHADVADSGMNPLVHYCLYGAAEDRNGLYRIKSDTIGS